MNTCSFMSGSGRRSPRSWSRPLAALLWMVVVVALAVAGCGSPGDGPVPYSTREVEGTVVLPTGASVDLGGYQVFSTANQAAITGGRFAVKIVDQPTFEVLFVADAAGSVLMLDILPAPDGAPATTVVDATSTALGLTLLRPWLAHMTEDVRVAAAQAITQSTSFKALVQAVSAKIAAGADLFDPAVYADLAPAVNAVLSSITPAQFMDAHFGPLTLAASGDTITVANTLGAAFAHVVGAYNPPLPGAAGKEYVVDGQKPVPGSLVELFQALAAITGGSSGPEQVTIPADGNRSP